LVTAINPEEGGRKGGKTDPVLLLLYLNATKKKERKGGRMRCITIHAIRRGKKGGEKEHVPFQAYLHIDGILEKG